MEGSGLHTAAKAPGLCNYPPTQTRACHSIQHPLSSPGSHSTAWPCGPQRPRLRSASPVVASGVGVGAGGSMSWIPPQFTPDDTSQGHRVFKPSPPFGARAPLELFGDFDVLEPKMAISQPGSRGRGEEGAGTGVSNNRQFPSQFGCIQARVANTSTLKRHKTVLQVGHKAKKGSSAVRLCFILSSVDMFRPHG